MDVANWDTSMTCTLVLALTIALALYYFVLSTPASAQRVAADGTPRQSLHDFVTTDADGEAKTMKELVEGKVVLVVNTASKCGFTKQFTGLQALYDKYKDRGLVVVGFPCNQFLSQEPGTAVQACSLAASKFKVTFPMMGKIDVNGAEESEIYKFLKTEKPGVFNSTSIKWNFTKFLVDRNGYPLERFGTTTKPESLESSIEKALLAAK